MGICTSFNPMGAVSHGGAKPIILSFICNSDIPAPLFVYFDGKQHIMEDGRRFDFTLSKPQEIEFEINLALWPSTFAWYLSSQEVVLDCSNSGGWTQDPKMLITEDTEITMWRDICLSADTPITMADGSFKRIDALEHGDAILAVDPWTEELTTDIITMCDGNMHKYGDSYDAWTFSDGTIIKTVNPHEFFNVRTQRMEYIADFQIGDEVRKQDGTTAALVSHKHVSERTRHCTLFTQKFNNYFANGILTGNRKSVKWGWQWIKNTKGETK